MTKAVLFTSGFLLFLFLIGCPYRYVKEQSVQVIKRGDLFPDTALQTPANSEDRRYLGLSGGKTFTLDQIAGNLVLVEMMNVYCASCRAQAPIYNKLYGLIENDPRTRGRIKVIAVAAGNGDLEVKEFRKEFAVPFPVVPDPGFAMHRAIGSTPTPFSIYVRQDSHGRMGRVVDTHLGPIFDYKDLFEQMAGMMTMDLNAIENQGGKTQAATTEVKSILTEREVEARVKNAFDSMGTSLEQFEKIRLADTDIIYTAIVKNGDGRRRFFAHKVSRSVPCDVCHDAHFIYLFDTAGKVVGFVPIQLTKYDNEPWDEADLSKIRSRLLGRYIFKPSVFDPKVDAVASATITAAVIFDSISKGEAIFEELRRKGLIP